MPALPTLLWGTDIPSDRPEGPQQQGPQAAQPSCWQRGKEMLLLSLSSLRTGSGPSDRSLPSPANPEFSELPFKACVCSGFSRAEHWGVRICTVSQSPCFVPPCPLPTHLKLGFRGPGDDDHPFAGIWTLCWCDLRATERQVISSNMSLELSPQAPASEHSDSVCCVGLSQISCRCQCV